MNIIRKICNWYFSRTALPYWCILLLDCAIVFLSGIVIFYLRQGGLQLAQHFWPLAAGLAVCLTVFVLVFRIFHTFLGFMRYSSFVDLYRLAYSDATACIGVCLLRQAQIKAASRVNEELLRYYWQLGADIDARGDENRYGAKFYDMLSHDLMEMMPGVEGFTRKNLQNATRFYRFYSTDENQKQLVSISPDEGDTQNRKQLVSKLKQTADRHIHLPHFRPSANRSADFRPHPSA